VPFGPAQVHAQDHLGPVGRFRAAGARADRQQGISLVVLAAEEEFAASLGVVALEFGRLAGDIGEKALVRLFLGEVQQLIGGFGTGLNLAP
jgi:hypothetical protein